MSKTKILVTGSGGFVFSNFIRYTLKNTNNYSIVGVDNCSSPNVLNTIYANKGHTFYIGNVTDPQFINVIFDLERPDIVIHGAANVYHDMVNTNVVGTDVITNACIKYNSRLIYMSTDKVYGSSEFQHTEDSCINPSNKYASTKFSGELIVKSAGIESNLVYNIVRPCNIYGPRQTKRNFIPTIISNVLDDKNTNIFGDGMQIRNWIHVQDHCTALLKIIESATNKEVYNISAQYEFRNIEIYQRVCNVLGRGHNLINHIKDRPGNDTRLSISSDKILNLGWKPSWTFTDGLVHTVNWYSVNKWFLK